MKSQHEHYFDLLVERYDNPCTAEEQAGEDAYFCPKCEKNTVRKSIRTCVICEWVENNDKDAQAEHYYNLEQEEYERLKNAYRYDEDGFCDGFMR